MKRILLFLIAIFFTANVFATGIGANDTTASCDNETLGQTSGTANIEVDWQPNTIAIRWYDGDTQLTVQSSAQTCVYDDNLYLPNVQPTKTGYTFKGWKVTKVPEGYTELEYIQSDGSQWIDTGIRQFCRTPLAVEFSFRPTELGGWMLGNGYTQINMVAGRGFSVNSISIARVTYDANSQETIYNNGVRIAGSSWSCGWDDLPIALFALGYYTNGGVAYTVKGAMYYAKIFNGSNELVRNFIPARRNSDSVLGMWDTISGTFFTNSGSGTFIAGPEVQ
jgi:hypothetical protein